MTARIEARRLSGADDLRVLTIRQPWAWAIVYGRKNVENRVRNIAGSYRGRVAIHVAQQFADIGDHYGRMIAAEVGRLSRAGLPGNEQVPSHVDSPDEPRHCVHRRYGHRGAVIGLVDLTDAHHAHGCPSHADDAPWPLCSRWAMRDHWHLALSNPRPIDPIPARGRLGLWRPDNELRARIEDALTSDLVTVTGRGQS